jgi:gluconokinase
MVVVIMGVSGSGKTTIGRALAHAAGGRFYDADDFHSEANIQKMRGGTPLTEADREPWLHALRLCIDAWLEQPGLSVLACSALTARSRALLGVGRPGVELVFLAATKAIIEARMRGRDHFMSPALLQSQFDALEPPEHALVLDASAPPDALVEQLLEFLGGSA